jgi:hypothetical protein
MVRPLLHLGLERGSDEGGALCVGMAWVSGWGVLGIVVGVV